MILAIYDSLLASVAYTKSDNNQSNGLGEDFLSVNQWKFFVATTIKVCIRFS